MALTQGLCHSKRRFGLVGVRCAMMSVGEQVCHCDAEML